MKNKGIIIGILIVLVGIGGYFAWKQNLNAPKEKDIIKIGAILPLTGDVAVYGNSLKKGVDLAVDRYNADSLNHKKIELVYEDSKANPKLAVSSFEKLISTENCNIVLGGFSSAEALSIAPIAEKNKIVFISPTASSPSLTNAGDYIFRTTPSDNFDGKIMARFAFNKLKLKNVAILFENNDYGIGISKVFIEKFTNLGGSIAIQKSFESGTKDFSSQLLAIKKANPDGLYIIADGEIGLILKQKQVLSFNSVKVFTVGLAESPKVIEIAGNASNGVCYSFPAFQLNSESDIIASFVSSFETKYKEKPDVLGAYGFDLMNITIEALKNSPTNSEEIKNELYNIKNFKGVTGNTSFDKNGDVEKSAGIKIINNGKFDWYINEFN